MLSDKIRECATIDRADSYNDKPERTALRTFLANSPNFQSFWTDYFGTPQNTLLMDNPLGKYKVDLGIVEYDLKPKSWKQKCKVHGLIEVDVFHSWESSYPSNYRYFHVLERKLKYFMDSDMGYITCTFNKYRNQMCCTTRENIEKILEQDGVKEIWMPKIQEYDRVVRCPLDENIHWFKLN